MNKERQSTSPEKPAQTEKIKRRLAWLEKNWPEWAAAGGGVALSLIGLWLLLRYLREKVPKDLQQELDEIGKKRLSDQELIKQRTQKLNEGSILVSGEEVGEDLEELIIKRGARIIGRWLGKICHYLDVPPGGRVDTKEQVISASLEIADRIVRPEMESHTKQSEPQADFPTPKT